MGCNVEIFKGKHKNRRAKGGREGEGDTSDTDRIYDTVQAETYNER